MSESLTNRINLHKNLHAKLKDAVNDMNYDECELAKIKMHNITKTLDQMSLDSEAANILENVNKKSNKRYEFLSAGGSGIIFKVFMNNDEYKFTVKIMYLTEQELQDKGTNLIRYKVWKESKILSMVTNLVINYNMHNFPINYNDKICTFGNDGALMSYNELYDASLQEWCKKSHSEEEWMNIIMQFWMSVYVMEKKLNIVHADLTWVNMLLLKTTKGGHWEYVIEGKKYCIPNLGFILIIWDFGSTRSLSFIDGKCRDNEHNRKYTKTIKYFMSSNRDLKKFNETSKRIKAHLLANRYAPKELEDVLKNNREGKYISSAKEAVEYENRRIFKGSLTAEQKEFRYKINLGYKIDEIHLFTKLYEAKKDTFYNENIEFKLVPKKINDIMSYTLQNIKRTSAIKLIEKFGKDYKTKPSDELLYTVDIDQVPNNLY
jgi:hypothetical protein